jgi:adenosine/AMP kinase
MSTRTVDQFIRALSKTAESPRLHYGVIVSAAAGTATIRVSGGTTEVTGVRYLADVTPTAGNVCVILSQGSDLLIIGTLT